MPDERDKKQQHRYYRRQVSHSVRAVQHGPEVRRQPEDQQKQDQKPTRIDPDPDAEHVHQLDRAGTTEHAAMVAQGAPADPPTMTRSNHMMELRARLAEVTDLRNVKQLLEWDHQTMMPPDGSSTRAESVGTLERLTHELFISDETGRLLEQTAKDLDGAAAASDDGSIV